MGNLYTQIVRKHDSRLQILSKLKYEHGCNPKNWDNIKELQEQLDRLTPKQKPTNYIKKYGAFGWKAKQMG